MEVCPVLGMEAVLFSFADMMVKLVAEHLRANPVWRI